MFLMGIFDSTDLVVLLGFGLQGLGESITHRWMATNDISNSDRRVKFPELTTPLGSGVLLHF